jgi:hypothetical protein
MGEEHRATVGPKAVRDTINALHGSFANNRGKVVRRVEEGPPQRWALSASAV